MKVHLGSAKGSATLSLMATTSPRLLGNLGVVQTLLATADGAAMTRYSAPSAVHFHGW
jgi:hypothetical protein